MPCPVMQHGIQVMQEYIQVFMKKKGGVEKRQVSVRVKSSLRSPHNSYTDPPYFRGIFV